MIGKSREEKKMLLGILILFQLQHLYNGRNAGKILGINTHANMQSYSTSSAM